MREVISVIGRMSERFAHNVSFGSRLRVWNGSHGRCLAESISLISTFESYKIGWGSVIVNISQRAPTTSVA